MSAGRGPADGAYSVRIEGRVQGVAFRYHAQEEAARLGIRGWVRNTDDGAVEVWAEGPEDALRRFLRWLEQGPPRSRVAAAHITAQPPSGAYKKFSITG